MIATARGIRDTRGFFEMTTEFARSFRPAKVRTVKFGRAVYIQLGGLAVAAVAIPIFCQIFPVADWLSAIQQRVMHLGFWSAICYPLLYASCNVLLLPGGVLSIGGGFFFGLWWGFLIVLVGNVGGAAISFWISRYLGRRWLRRKLFRSVKLRTLEPVVRREGWKIILLSQLHPLFPTSLLNYLYGLTPIRFRTCMVWVAIGQAPGLFLYVYLGTLGQLGLNLFRGKSHPRLFEYFLWVGGLVTLVLALGFLGRLALRIFEGVEDKSVAKRNMLYTSSAKNVNV